jgi:hypothetical protein
MLDAFVNDMYSVQRYLNATAWGTVIQLSVRSHFGKVIPWDDLQRIKSELAGPDSVAIEIFPAQADLVDEAPMRHLWVLPKKFVPPFGLHRDESWGWHGISEGI